MVSYYEFLRIASQETRALPEYTSKGLSGGVLVDEGVYLHPKRLADDLYILGVYEQDRYGKRIVLYYGSFMMVYGNMDAQQLRIKVRDTIRHEFLHHLEYRAGITGKGSLIEVDRNRLEEYYRLHGSR